MDPSSRGGCGGGWVQQPRRGVPPPPGAAYRTRPRLGSARLGSASVPDLGSVSLQFPRSSHQLNYSSYKYLLPDIPRSPPASSTPPQHAKKERRAAAAAAGAPSRFPTNGSPRRSDASVLRRAKKKRDEQHPPGREPGAGRDEAVQTGRTGHRLELRVRPTSTSDQCDCVTCQ